MSLNDILTIVSIALVLVLVFSSIIIVQRKKPEDDEDKLDTMEKVVEHIKQQLVELDKDDYSVSIMSSNAEFERAYRRKARLRDALANCIHGIEGAKNIVIDIIRNTIITDISTEHIKSILNYESDILPEPNVQFEILLFKFKQQYGKQALSKLIEKYSFALRRNDNDAAYYVSKEDLETAYSLENPQLNEAEQAAVLAVLVYQQVKGFGIIDTIREMDIDGINIGTSGALVPQIKQAMPIEYRGESSVWIFFGGKQIHLRFLSFENEDEIRRIILNLIRYGGKGALNRNVGKIVTTAPDKARITALCPPAAECWVAFIRKFGFSGKTPEQLLIKEYTNNGELAVQTAKYLMWGLTTCALTGRQGSGKTTLLSSLIGYIDPRYTIRTLEMSFEMYLRDVYPTRNILAVQETSTVPASVLQDTLKKTDAAVSIVGEVATDDVAARMIQMGQVASLFTLFSHHANTADDLVLALRNSLVNAGNFSNMETAERQVIDVVKVDIHLNSTADGRRYVERITEIVPLPPGVPYPKYNPENPADSMAQITKEYYQRVTDRKSFTTRQILHYDLETNTYVADQWFSDTLTQHMINSMGSEKTAEFLKFQKENWGE